ncbi:MAG: TetR/AcrR family transcriptional regulator [Bacteroidetes bacterium]|nr:TetR/AcrR family transcriptional regulator [Bacteroidota bacterium]
MASKSKDRFAELRQKSISSIKETALDLFAHNGFHNTSISAIAKAAGISKGLIYNYFESKEDLLHKIIEEAVDEGEKFTAYIFKNIGDPYLQLKEIVEISIQAVTSNLEYWKLLTALALQTEVLSELKQVLMQKQIDVFETMEGIFRNMNVEDPKKEAYFFGALLDGLFLHYISMIDSYPLEEMKEFIINKYSKENFGKLLN